MLSFLRKLLRSLQVARLQRTVDACPWDGPMVEAALLAVEPHFVDRRHIAHVLTGVVTTSSEQPVSALIVAVKAETSPGFLREWREAVMQRLAHLVPQGLHVALVFLPETVVTARFADQLSVHGLACTSERRTS